MLEAPASVAAASVLIDWLKDGAEGPEPEVPWITVEEFKRRCREAGL